MIVPRHSAVPVLAVIALVATVLFSLGAARQAELCADGTYHQLGYCPADLSSPGSANVDTTTADGTVSIDRDDGTLYGCVTTSATPLAVSEILDCSGGAAVAGDSELVDGSGTRTLSATGLTADTGYYWQFVNIAPTGWSSNAVVSSQFTTDAEGGSEPYDLSGFTIDAATQCDWPTEPVTNGNTATASTVAELQTAIDNATEGVEITITWSGTQSGNVVVDNDDIDIVMPNDATIDGDIRIGSRTSSVSRVRWTGGNQDEGNWTLDEADDVMINDFYSVHDAAFDQFDVNDMRCSPGGCNRVAFVHVTFEGKNPDDGDSYTFYTAPNPGITDCMILADFRTFQSDIGNGAAHVTRMQGTTRFTIVDAVFENPYVPTGDTTAFRFHRNVTNAHVENVHVRGRMKLDTIDAGEVSSVTNGDFVNVTRYGGDNCLFAAESGVTNTGTVRDSLLYYDSGLSCSDMSFTQLTDVSNNDVAPWDGTTFPRPDSNGNTPNLSTVGADR